MSLLRIGYGCLMISGLLVLGSFILLVVPGPKLSIEFTGGTFIELSALEGMSKENITQSLDAFRAASGETLGNISVAETQEGNILLRFRTITNEEHQALLAHITEQFPTITEQQYTAIGPTVGSTLKRRALWALAIASLAIITYIAVAFRKVPRRYSPWSFGVTAVIALLHDVAITMGLFTILGQFTTFDVDMLFVSALLSIMGYSVNDKIVIFDRIRGNLLNERKNEDLNTLVNRSLWETLTRTINTGVGALIMLFALFFFGAASIRWFMLALIVGTVVGTYSSFFVAVPLLVWWQGQKR